MEHLKRNGARIFAMLGLVLGPFCQAFAQDFVTEVEPNDPCPQAQEIGAFALPLVLDGSLNTTPESPDVDFYRFSATPGMPLAADLEGLDTGKDTLPDPYLGLFNSNCELIEYNDDFNSLNSRLEFNVPADGVFVLAASSCCDQGFSGEGGSSGTYQLTISEPPPPPPSIGSISGRVVDAFSGDPLPGDAPPFATVELLLCEYDYCSYISSQNTDSEGRFMFDQDYFGQLFPVGTYQVRAYANEYQVYETEWFEVGENEDYDVGDVALTPPPSIGSISGRVVDDFSGDPLPGDAPPFATVELLLCEYDYCSYISSQNTDSEGRFMFDQDYFGQLFPVGTYQVRAYANEYQGYETEPFEVGENEDYDVGDITLIPPPIVFSDIQPCSELLPQGGSCSYSVRINNNTSAPLRGLAWSLVDGHGIGSSLDFTTFEANASISRTSTFVRRQRVFLEASSSDVVEFQFDVPSFVRDGATFCTRLFFGLEPYPLINTNREGFLFCVTKGVTGFEVMGASESQALLRSVSGKNKLMMGTWIRTRMR